MGGAVTFCGETEHEYRQNEHGYSFFRWSEAESLPHFAEFETPVLFDQGYLKFASIRGLARRSLARRRVISPAHFLLGAIGLERTDNVV